jgi:hypothetical protein
MLASMTARQDMIDSVGAGLCANCVHVRRIESDRGSVFFLCELALTDKRFRKYPRLPVLSCDGYEPRDRQADDLTQKEPEL